MNETIINDGEDMNSDTPKKRRTLIKTDAKDADDRNSDQKGTDESECDRTVTLLTLEGDAVPGAEKDNGSDPYSTDWLDS